MKNYLLFLGFIISLSGISQVTSLSLETVNANIGIVNTPNSPVDLTGYATYRLYAICATEETKVLTAWGNMENPAVLATTTSFWNSPNGAVGANSINPAAFSANPALQYDSWIALGCENNADCQMPLNNLFYFDLGSDYSISNLYQSFGNQQYSDGSACVMNHVMGTLWGMTPISAQPAGADLKILLGQFTTTGEVFGQLNLQIRTGTFACGDTLENVTLTFGDYAEGCSDVDACNYDGGSETTMNQVCLYPGCTDELACNYAPNAVCPDNSCIYVAGCTNPDACNYDPLAVCSDPSLCMLPGCDDPTACNYDPASCGGEVCIGLQGCSSPDASNYNPSATCDDGSCIIYGCTDPTACNYFALATIDDGSCTGLKGCLNPQACNYNPDATCSSPCTSLGCSDPTACNYNPNSCGTSGYCSHSYISFFDDNNENGIQNTLESNYTGYILLHVEPGNLDFTSNNSGSISLSNLPAGSYTVTVVEYESGWQLTTPSEFTLASECQNFRIGLTNNQGSACAFSTSFSQLNCLNSFGGNIVYANYSDEPVNVLVNLEYDNALSFLNAYYSASHTDHSITWQLDNFLNGQYTYFNFHLEHPILSAIGNQYIFNVTLYVTSLTGQVLCDTVIPVYRTFLCGYDPNDKIAEPIGYRDEHFILNDQELLYTIHFQNTGNAPAENVKIIDPMDTSIFDLHSLQIVNASHPMVAMIDYEAQTVHFDFDDIQLAALSADEEGSKGSVTFSIHLQDNLPAWTVIENDASILFDFNDPIYTSTTHHTIFDCDALVEPLANVGYCEGDSALITADVPYAETLVWEFEGNALAEGNALLLNQTEIPTMDIHLIASNPLCARDNEFVADVHPLPQVEINFIPNGIAGPAGYTYEWYVNNNLVTSQTGNELIYEFPDLSSIFAIVTNEFGCSAMSNTQYIIHTQEEQANEFYLFPNPMKNQTILKTPPGDWNMRMYNSTGQLMRSSTIRTQQMVIEKNDLTSGVYTIELSNVKTQTKKTLVVE